MAMNEDGNVQGGMDIQSRSIDAIKQDMHQLLHACNAETKHVHGCGVTAQRSQGWRSLSITKLQACMKILRDVTS